MTEETLRKHYYIAKVSGKTSQQYLDKQMSPQKHMIKEMELFENSESVQKDDILGIIDKQRGETVDDISA